VPGSYRGHEPKAPWRTSRRQSRCLPTSEPGGPKLTAHGMRTNRMVCYKVWGQNHHHWHIIWECPIVQCQNYL
jgi:hypothetical protein